MENQKRFRNLEELLEHVKSEYQNGTVENMPEGYDAEGIVKILEEAAKLLFPKNK